MGYYKDEVEVVAHNINNLTVTVDKDTTLTGIESVEIERKEDEVDTLETSDGLSIFVENPSKAGSIKIQMLEASQETGKMWTLRKNNSFFAISCMDAAIENFDCSGKRFRIKKAPIIVRDKEPKMLEWECVTTYLKSEGGTWKLLED